MRGIGSKWPPRSTPFDAFVDGSWKIASSDHRTHSDLYHAFSRSRVRLEAEPALRYAAAAEALGARLLQARAPRAGLGTATGRRVSGQQQCECRRTDAA